MLKVYNVPNSAGRKIIYTDETFPTRQANGYDLKTGDKVVYVGAEPKEYLWNGYEWITGGSESGGVEMVYNGTGSSIAAGKLVYRNGWNATYNCFTIALADADVSGAQAELVATEAIANGATGAASTVYELTGQNTSAANAVGDPVYLDTTAGGWTLTAPTGSDDVVQVIGRVAVDHASTGKIRFIVPGVLKEIGTNELQDDSVTLDKLANVTQGSVIVGGEANAPTLLDANDSGKILVGDGTDLKSVAVSGDVSLAANGGVTIAALAVEEGMIAAGAVTENKLGAAAVTTDKINDAAVTPAKTSGVAVLYNLGTPALAVANSVCASQDMGNKTYTLEASPDPDIPRNVTVTRAVIDVADTPGIITVTGTNYSDAVITEEIIPGDNGADVAGAKAFKSITSVVGSGWTQGGSGADTIVVGTGNELGLHKGTNVAVNIMLGILGTTITAHNAAVGGTVAIETTTVDMSTGTYDGAKAALIFQKH